MKLVGVGLLIVMASAVSTLAYSEPSVRKIAYKIESVDGVDIFYREAGDPAKPTLVLLHGFPTSSHMFRNLIPALRDQYHVIAPDYPGFGQSSKPSVKEFTYTFDHLAEVIDHFL